MKQRGLGQIEMIVGVVTIGLLVAGFYAFISYVSGVEKKADKAGYDRAMLLVAQRDNKQLTEAQGTILRLQKEKADLEAQHAAAVVAADEEATRRVADVERRKDAFVSDVVAGRIRLFDPGKGKADASCPGGGGGTGPTTVAGAGVDHGAGGTELSPELAKFLGEEASRADKVVVKLTACQAILRADRKAVN